MSKTILKDLISIDDARILFESINVKTRTISVPLELSTGRILAEDIISDIDVPGFDKSLKDGYAVCSEDFLASSNSSVSLKIIGFSQVGKLSDYSVNHMEAVEVATGALIPKDFDAVVMVEDTERYDDHIIVKTSVKAGQNILFQGSDIAGNECVLHQNSVLKVREIGVLAAIGKRQISAKTIVVGIISTGNELEVPGEVLQPGMIYDTNSYSLYSAAIACGMDAVSYGIIKDDWDALNNAVLLAVKECDIVLTSGSTSAGEDDFICDIIEDSGTVLAHGMNFKPGKPVALGLINDIPIIALPGHPASSLTIFYEFILPILRRSLNLPQIVRPVIKAVLGENIVSGKRHEFLAVKLIDGQIYSANKSSAAITTLAHAEGFIEIPADVKTISRGKAVEVILFDNSFI